MGRDARMRRRRNGNHRKSGLLPWRLQRTLAGFCARARSNIAMEHSIPIRRDLKKRLILLVAGMGIIFLASAVQTFGTNWIGQACPYPGPCFHVEWLAIGVVLSAAAYFAWKRSP
jgi:hypothetical protein